MINFPTISLIISCSTQGQHLQFTSEVEAANLQRIPVHQKLWHESESECCQTIVALINPDSSRMQLHGEKEVYNQVCPQFQVLPGEWE
jgi:hypothetical protein